MHIKKIVSQSRRDFTTIYKCEHCGDEHEDNGYDDANSHQNAIPDIECPKCKRKAGDDYRALAPKYPTGQQL